LFIQFLTQLVPQHPNRLLPNWDRGSEVPTI
jgi:hypothetical protein